MKIVLIAIPQPLSRAIQALFQKLNTNLTLEADLSNRCYTPDGVKTVAGT